MSIPIYLRVSALIFGLVALAHLVRLVAAWPVTIAGAEVPVFISLFGFLIPGVLAYFGITLSLRDKSG